MNHQPLRREAAPGAEAFAGTAFSVLTPGGDTIREAIFSQRAMKRPSIGKCSLDPATSQDDVDGFRCAW